MEAELFTRPHEVPIIICKKCEYAVRPKEVIYHLHSTQHRIPLSIARQISETMFKWDKVQECDQWIVPNAGLLVVPIGTLIDTLLF
jgi:hypothetical protein